MREHERHHATAIDKAIAKYGSGSFAVEVVDTAETVDELNRKEREWIAFYDCIAPKGYNLCEGGDNTQGFHHREESRRKMSESKSRKYKGAANPFYGKQHSEESKRRMSETHKGMAHLTTEQVDNLRKSHYRAKVRNVETGEVFDSVQDAANAYGVKATHITRVCRGKRKTTGGFHWEYAA